MVTTTTLADVRTPLPTKGEPAPPWAPAPPSVGSGACPPPSPASLPNFAGNTAIAYGCDGEYVTSMPLSPCSRSSPTCSSAGPASSFTSSSSGSTHSGRDGHRAMTNMSSSSIASSPAPAKMAAISLPSATTVRGPPSSPVTPPSPFPSSVPAGLPQLTDVYVCPHGSCTKSFARRYNLATHLRRHTGETPYGCPVATCGKRFKWRSSMAHHLRSHRRAGLVIEARPIRKSKGAPVYGSSTDSTARGVPQLKALAKSQAAEQPPPLSQRPSAPVVVPLSSVATDPDVVRVPEAATVAVGAPLASKGGLSANRPAPLVVPPATPGVRRATVTRHNGAQAFATRSGASGSATTSSTTHGAIVGAVRRPFTATGVSSGDRSQPPPPSAATPSGGAVHLPQLPMMTPLPATMQPSGDGSNPTLSPTSVPRHAPAGMAMGGPVALSPTSGTTGAGGGSMGGAPPTGVPVGMIPMSGASFVPGSYGDLINPPLGCDFAGFLPLGGGRALDSPVSSAGSAFGGFVREGTEPAEVPNPPSFEASAAPVVAASTTAVEPPIPSDDTYAHDFGVLMYNAWAL